MPRKGTATAVVSDRSPFVGAVVELVPLNEVHIDYRYQRMPKTSTVDRIVEAFDPWAFGVLTGVMRPDTQIYVVDGSNRRAAAERMGWAAVPMVLAPLETIEEEAALFLNANTRSYIYALDRHRARVTSGDPEAVELEAAVMAADLRIGYAGTGNAQVYVAAVGTLYRILNRYGAEAVTRTLRVVRDAFHSESFEGRLLHAMTMVLATFTDDDKGDRDIVRRVRGKTLTEVYDEAKRRAATHPTVRDVACAIAWAHNEARGAKWDLWSLTQ